MNDNARKSPPPPPAPAQPTSSFQRKNSSHVRPTIVLKRRPTLQPDNPAEKMVEAPKSYAEMATKAITPAEDVVVIQDSTPYDKAFPSLGAETAARVVSSSEAGSTKPPISAQTKELQQENLAPAAPDNRSKEHGPKAPISRRRNSSYGSSKGTLDHHKPKDMVRSVSIGGRDKPHFSPTQGWAKKESSSVPKPGKRRNSGYHNATRSHIESYSTKPDEGRGGHHSHNPATHSSNPVGHRGFPKRRGSYSGRGRGRPSLSPDRTPLKEISWRPDHSCCKKKGSVKNGGECIGETSSPAEHSPISQWGESPIRATTRPSDITRPVFEHWTDDTSPGSEGRLEEGRVILDLEGGHGKEIEPSTPTPEPETANVARCQVSPFSSSSRTALSLADDTPASKPHDTPNNLPQLSLQSSAPPPPVLDTPTPSTRLTSLRSLNSPPRKLVLPTMSDSYEERMEKSKKLKRSLLLYPLPERPPRPKLSVNEYLGIVDEYPWPHKDGVPLNPPPSAAAKMEGNTMFDNKTAIRDTDKVADPGEGYEAIGPSKVVQYASTVQGKASKALAGHNKVNFGDIDHKKAAPAPGQVGFGKTAFNPLAGFTDQHSQFAGQSSEDRLPPGSAQPPPGLSLPPGLPIPASYYQQQSIALETEPGNTPFPQPTERATPFAQTADNPRAVSGQYRLSYPDMGSLTLGQRSDVNEYDTALSLFLTTLLPEVLWLT